MRAIKSSLDKIVQKIEAEYAIEYQRKLDSELKRLSRDNAVKLKELERAKATAELIERDLEKAGLMTAFNEIALSHEKKEALREECKAKKARFVEMRDRILIRLPVADEAEKSLMMRHFFDAAIEAFPMLKSIIGKWTL